MPDAWIAKVAESRLQTFWCDRYGLTHQRVFLRYRRIDISSAIAGNQAACSVCVDLGFVAPHAFVMYQNISEWLTVDYLIVYKALPIVSRIYFHQKSSTSAYVPEDLVTHSLYAQITFVNDPLFPDIYFVSFICFYCV